MTQLSISLFDENHPTRSEPIARGMASGRPSIALRAEFAAPAFPDDRTVVIFELSPDNLEALLGCVRGMEAGPLSQQEAEDLMRRGFNGQADG